MVEQLALGAQQFQLRCGLCQLRAGRLLAGYLRPDFIQCCLQLGYLRLQLRTFIVRKRHGWRRCQLFE